MEFIQTNKRGAKLCLDGHTYTKKSASNVSIFWCCTKRTLGCKGAVRTTSERTDPVITKDHNHAPDNTAISVTKVRNSMKQQAKDTRDKPAVVYANSVAQLDEAAMAELPSVDICKRTIRNQRDPEFPVVPNLLQDLLIQGEWTQTIDGRRFLLFDNGAEAESRILVFATDSQLQQLAEAVRWMMDGNFAMAPRLFSQLYVIRVPLGTSTIPVAFAFLQHQRQSTYEELFQCIMDKCNQLFHYYPTPEIVVLDFELAAIQAIRSVVGEDVEIQGCFYHLTQSTWRKVQALGLANFYKENDDFKRICGMMDGLAFLPVPDVIQGMDLLRRIAMPEADDVLDYFDSTYVNGMYRNVRRGGHNVIRRQPARFPPEVWNVHEATLNDNPRTNNQCEGWNNKFYHLVGNHHPSVFLCIKNLKLEERTATASIAQHAIGNFHPRQRKNIYILQQTRLHNLCADYNAGRRDMENFLGAVGHNIRFEI